MTGQLDGTIPESGCRGDDTGGCCGSGIHFAQEDRGEEARTKEKEKIGGREREKDRL